MGAFLNILSSLLSGIGKVGGAIGSGIGNVAQGIGGGIEGLAKNISTGGAPMGGFWEGSGGNANSTGIPQGGLKGAFANPLLAQLLAAEGADLMGNTPGKNLGGAIQQNISSRNMAKVFSTILAGGTPPPGIKHTIDGGAEPGTHKRTITVDHSIFDMGSIKPDVEKIGGGVPLSEGLNPDVAKFLAGVGNPSPSQPATNAPAPAGDEAQVPTTAPVAAASTTQDPMIQLLTQMLGGGQVNPAAGFANLRPADLAGVSPEMLSQALQFKMQQEQLGKKNIMEVMDLMMRGKELGIRAPYMKALTDEAIDRVAANQPVIQIGGIPYNTAEYLKWQQVQKENLSTNQRDYSTYAAQETAAGRQPKSFEGFLNNNFTNDIKNYRLYSDQETKAGRTPKDFDPWLTEHERSRAMTMIEKAGGAAMSKVATGNVEARTQLHDPKAIQAAVDTARASLTDVPSMTAQLNPAKATALNAKLTIQEIEKMIAVGGGTITKPPTWDKDGKTIVWTIQWPPIPGEKPEPPEVFRYAVK